MNQNSRRKFIGNIVGGGIGIGAISSMSFVSKDKKDRGFPKKLPVVKEVDICVLGGSCTGVFAAVQAARLGAKVAIVEKQNAFGGVATNAMVNIWHSLYDTGFKQQIIAGLTLEVLERLSNRNTIKYENNIRGANVTFNSQELKIELDELIIESGIHPYLHTLFSEPVVDQDDNLTGIVVDNKSGRGIIKANYFIDATGDGDLAFRLRLKSYTNELLQPPTTTAHMEGWDYGEFNRLYRLHREEFNIPEGFVWGADVIGTNAHMLAGTRVFNVNCAIADDLTRAEMEGRRQVRAIMDMMRKYGDQKIGLTALASHIGIRETRHIKCMYQVSDDDALYGKRFEDAIANGSYRFDLHRQDKPGITFKYLDGKETYVVPGQPIVEGRWRDETETNPTFYQIPLRAITPVKFGNLMIAGRMFDAEITAFSGMRVMVNMNQLGEAAGVASYLALSQNIKVQDLNPLNVRATLKKGGAFII
jgi:ribulose 1,5-bisphosphate synthetase/thiazole synthase